MKRTKIEELKAIYMTAIKAGQSSLPFSDEAFSLPIEDNQSSLPFSDDQQQDYTG